jgi:hypothetical protein
MLDPTSATATDIYDRRVLGIDSNPLRAPFGSSLADGLELDGPSLEEVLDDSVTEFFRLNQATQSMLRGVPRSKSDSYVQRSLGVLLEGPDDDGFEDDWIIEGIDYDWEDTEE